MLKVSTWNCNGLFMSLLEVSTRKPIMVFYYKTTKGFVSRTVWENRLRFSFETFISFSVNKNKYIIASTQTPHTETLEFIVLLVNLLSLKALLMNKKRQ